MVIFTFLILPRSGQTHGFREMPNRTGISSSFIPRRLFFCLIFCLDLLQLVLQAQEAGVVRRFLFIMCSVFSHIAKPPQCVWVGWMQTWRAETGVTHSPLSCFWERRDNNLVVTFRVCMLWTGLLVMARAGGADLYWFKKPLCLT